MDKKDNCEEINNAKTILTSLNENSTYMLYDRFGNIAENISGKQLYEAHYDPVSEKIYPIKIELHLFKI